jgi:5'-methylthioadenosine phosphorylase
MSELRIGLIGGTGLGEALGAEGGVRHEVDTPFGRPSDAIVECEWAGAKTLVLPRHGPGHVLNPAQVPYQANIFALKKLGCTHILASGAVGSLREEFKPRDLVVVDQVIDKTWGRANTFFERAAVHVELAEPFDTVLRQMVVEAGKGSGFGVQGSGDSKSPSSPPSPGAAGEGEGHVHDGGCYVCMEGPAFSTRAESLMHRLWGGDVIGMTAMPEAKLAREAEIPYALIALVTDYDCWRAKPASAEPLENQKTDPFVLLKEILANVKSASANAITLMRKTVELMAANPQRLEACPAQHALRLGI